MPSLNLVSNCTVFPDQKSTLGDLKLSVSDLPMLSCHYIQKGCLFTPPSLPLHSLSLLLKASLQRTLSLFPPLAGRLKTLSTGDVYITCNDAGVEFVLATATGLYIRDILAPTHVPDCVKQFFVFDHTVSYAGHFQPILAVQVTELADGIFIGCTVNHAVVDGTSFWNFFNTFAEDCRGVTKIISRKPDFRRESILISKAVLRLPEGGPKLTFDADAPTCERVFSFSREAILELKAKTNNIKWTTNNGDAHELLKKQSNDTYQMESTNKVVSLLNSWLKSAVPKPQAVEPVEEISSFQSLCALVWQAVTRARNLASNKTTTFRMAVNCRHRLEPKLDPYYFGNAIQSIPTYATVGDVISNDLRWCAEQLNKNVKAHDDASIRRSVEDWESHPRCFPLGNSDGASITMGSSHRFPVYENDFGWGRPLAVRSGGANKFDGKISAFPGREGGGSVDLEMILSPETMSILESDLEFMHYVSS